MASFNGFPGHVFNSWKRRKVIFTAFPHAPLLRKCGAESMALPGVSRCKWDFKLIKGQVDEVNDDPLGPPSRGEAGDNLSVMAG